MANGSGGTVGGLMVRARALAPEVTVIGINVDGDYTQKRENVTAVANVTAEALGLQMTFSEEDTIVFHDCVGKDYGVVDENISNAIVMFARHEAVMLDPVYTGKAAAGLIDLVKRGYFEGSRGVILSIPVVRRRCLSYEDDLLEHVK